MNKIVIFWIEDNPLLDFEVDDESGLRYPKLPSDNHFQIYLFQHPMEVKEYLDVVNDLRQRGMELSEEFILPNIIVFDYKLSDNFNLRGPASLSYTNKDHYDFIKKHSATFQMKNLISEKLMTPLFIEREDVEMGNYLVDELKKQLNLEDTQNLDDEFGLFSGITMLREFKDYITFGVPATINKADKTAMTFSSSFFEWLNIYDLGDAIDRPEKNEKGWESIIRFALPKLRGRIIEQVKKGLVTISFKGLKLIIDNPDSSNSLIVSTNYGIRRLSIDALFADTVENKNKEIKQWAEQLVGFLNEPEYLEAKSVAESLINAFQTKNLVENRVRLSLLTVQYCNGDINLDNKEFQELLGQFGVSKDKLEAARKGEKANKQNIDESIAKDYRILKPKSIEVQRLSVLFLDLLLHRAWEKFCNLNENSNLDEGFLRMLKERPMFNDLRSALFPIAQNPLVLPYHHHLLEGSESGGKYYTKDPFEVWITCLTKKRMKELNIYPNFPANLTNFEIQLCQSFVLDINLGKNYFPIWMNA